MKIKIKIWKEGSKRGKRKEENKTERWKEVKLKKCKEGKRENDKKGGIKAKIWKDRRK